MKKTAFFTMDVESFREISCLREHPCEAYDSFRIEHAIGDYLDLLDRYDIKATFFVLCTSLEASREFLTRAVKSGHEIALHGLSHEIPAQMDGEERKRQIAEGRALIERELDTEVIGYRAPCFAVTDEVIDVIRGLGFQYDSSNLDIKMSYIRTAARFDGFERVSGGILKKGGFYEFSPCKTKTVCGMMNVSGGAYLRLAPQTIIQGGVKKFLKTSDYYMFYCHPADVFQNELPRLKGLSPFQAYFVNAGRKKFLRRVEKIIKMLIDSGYSFSTMRDFVKNIQP